MPVEARYPSRVVKWPPDRKGVSDQIVGVRPPLVRGVGDPRAPRRARVLGLEPVHLRALPVGGPGQHVGLRRAMCVMSSSCYMAKGV